MLRDRIVSTTQVNAKVAVPVISLSQCLFDSVLSSIYERWFIYIDVHKEKNNNTYKQLIFHAKGKSYYNNLKYVQIKVRPYLWNAGTVS